MSFALTKPQLIDGSKTVTRRMGWLSLKAGDELIAVEKCMGLKKGEKMFCKAMRCQASDLVTRIEFKKRDTCPAT